MSYRKLSAFNTMKEYLDTMAEDIKERLADYDEDSISSDSAWEEFVGGEEMENMSAIADIFINEMKARGIKIE